MRLRTILIAPLLLGAIPSAHAQQDLAGKYEGAIQGQQGRRFGVSLEISRVEGSTVSGTMVSFTPGSCRGNYKIEGTADNGVLNLQASDGPHADCRPVLKLQVSGNKLVGTMGAMPLELAK